MKRLALVLLVGSIACGSKKGIDTDASIDDAGLDDETSIITDMPDATTGIIVTPPLAQLTTSGSPVTQQFTAIAADTMMPVTPTWSLDNVALGSIDANGLFTATGNVGGAGGINAELNGALGKATVEVNVTMSENPGNVSMNDQTALKNGGNADSAFRWLYPYDQTVMLRGLQPPLMQFDGQPASSAMVHITGKHIDYTGFFGSSSPTQIAIAPTVWAAIEKSIGPSDPMTVTVTKMSNGQVTGPKTETWQIAQGSARGVVYYNTYSNGGTMFKLKVGSNAQTLFGNCQVCHSASASGNVLAATGGTYDLKNNGAPMVNTPGGRQYSFAGVYPDGSFLLTTYTTSPGSAGTSPPELRDAKTGMKINAPGLDGSGIQGAMPAFSPDGKKVVFNDGNSNALSVMNFDVKTKTFSGKTQVLQAGYPGWPQFTPDGNKVLYHDDSVADFTTGFYGQAFANIKMVDVMTKQVTSLDALNGVKGNGTYLPWGTAEANMNYEPTLLPLAVGGYYWVVFTTRRCYGNTLTPTLDPDPFVYQTSRRKKLWLAAIDINMKPGVDPSHPPIYLPGQDLPTGNMRGFWSLDPCKQNGQTCTSGDECCGGFCRQQGNMKVCVPPPGGCAMEFETCVKDADCCGNGSGTTCIAGHCGNPIPK